MIAKRFLSLLTVGAMSLSIVSVSAMSMEGDAMMKPDTMMKSDDSMMMKIDMMKKMTREERVMKAKEKAKMRATARKMRWAEKAKMMKDQGMMKKDMMEKSESMMKKDEGAMMKEGVMMKAGEYKDSTASALPDSVLSDGKTKVLFFHAAWCPACKAANTTLASWYSPGEGLLTTYKINYDTEKSLKQTYGVTYQHTFVKVDGQGKLIKLLQGPSDEELKNLLKM